MTIDAEVWRALSNLRASHREGGCQRAGCAIASLHDEDLEEILHAVPPKEATVPVADAALRKPHQGPPLSVEAKSRRAGAVAPAAQIAEGGGGDFSPDGVASEKTGSRFEVGDRVVYDPEASVNMELGSDYAGLGICTVTELNVAAYGQLLSFVDERGDLHDGWWADRFKAASREPIPEATEAGEGEVTYFVAFRSTTGYGHRVLDPRPRIVTAADVIALTDLLATDVGGDVVPLNWIELPPPLPETTQAREVAFNSSGSSTEIRSTLTPIRIDRAKDHRVLNGSITSMDRTTQTHPARAAAPDERPDLPYLPRRAM